jgi:uncharacterized protein
MPNRLAKETSPYLQQHAENPVDWYPWGEEALAKAKAEGKPILLSIGYSACHWCHVMAHESFEDPQVAKVMNDLFVNIKVDREERPDIDQIYQTAQAMLTQRNGGWPLTMFLTADQVPFFGGTYFPKTTRYGLPGFGDLLGRVRTYHDEKREDIDQQNGELLAALGRTQPTGAAHPAQFERAPLDLAIEFLGSTFDRQRGGFGQAPKFPHPDSISTCMRHFAATGDAVALHMATFTLRKMAEGGIFDQLGGGFARYSVDDEWAIPHFEKMLYDNGWLIGLYADAWALTQDALFRRTVEETAAWVMREMQSPEGGYYSSFDADSEHEEGKFYVWTPDEVRSLLTAGEFAVVEKHYGLDRPANFEGHAWNFVVTGAVADEHLLASARAKLFAARSKRVAPGRDDKVLTSWNALMIGGLARAARIFGRDDWLDSARRALAFLRQTMWRDGRLLATWKDGNAHLNAYLDDHAFLLAAILEMLQADFRAADLEWAEAIGDALLGSFHDTKDGGFFFTSHDHERLIHRPKPGHDNATPSGNGIAAWALNRLSFLTGEMRYQHAAESALALHWPSMRRNPAGFGSLLATLEETLVPPRTVIVNGPREALGAWKEGLRTAYLPDALVLFIANEEMGSDPFSAKRDLTPFPLAKPAGPTVNAWVCEGVTCLPPIAQPDTLRETLKIPRIPAS